MVLILQNIIGKLSQHGEKKVIEVQDTPEVHHMRNQSFLFKKRAEVMSQNKNVRFSEKHHKNL